MVEEREQERGSVEVEGLLLTAGVRPFVTLMEPPLPSNKGVQLETHLAIHPKPPHAAIPPLG